ncbi:MAG: choice-of-anchor I family protein, partial [Candidatus Latescibacterota bacterium]
SFGAGVNSVAVHNGIIAVAVESSPKQNPGRIVFFNANGTVLKDVPAGALPDMVAFTPDGRYLLAANEGEPSDDYTNDPEGSITIVNLSNGVGSATTATATFTAFNSQATTLRAQGLRIFGPNASVAQDIEPEYIAISADSRTAYVSLQENNALAIVNIANASITAIKPLGTKDHTLIYNAIDASDRDGGMNMQTWPIRGYYMPDAIASFEINGKTYIASANEGDSRDYGGYSEETRVGDLTLDPTAFPNAATLQNNANLGRLKTTTAQGDTDGDGDHDIIYSYGGRSFSIWDDQGNLVFDSANDFERITARQVPSLFNSQGASDSYDSRSDDK